MLLQWPEDSRRKTRTETLCVEPIHSSSLTAESKLEKPEQELSGQPESPKQPLQPSVPAPQQECQPQEQEPRKRDEGRERRPSQEKRREMDRHQEPPSQREAEEATPQDGGGSRSEWHSARFWIPLACIPWAICSKGGISLEPLEADPILCKSWHQVVMGCPAPKVLPNCLCNCLWPAAKLAAGWGSSLSTAAGSLARSYPGLSNAEEGPVFCSVFWEGKVSDWRWYSMSILWRGKQQWLPD